MKQWALRGASIFMILGYVLVFLQEKLNSFGMYSMTVWEYAQQRINLIPLTSIWYYIQRLQDHKINADICWRFFLLATLCGCPLGIILPTFFTSCRKPGRFTLTTVLLLFAKETADLLLKIGSFDVDSVLLSLIGAWIGYLIYQAVQHISLRSPLPQAEIL